MPLKTIQDEMPTLNMTPMIDVVFLLMIFFMAGTKFADMERNLELNLPQLSDLQGLTDAPAHKPIHVYRDGKIGYEKQMIEVEELRQRLQSARADNAGLGVIVRGDGEAMHRHLVRVLKACHDAGIQQLSISARLGDQGS
jgi:biopolymer transport protein ExbD